MLKRHINIYSPAGDPSEDMLAEAGLKLCKVSWHEKVDLSLLTVDRGRLHANNDVFSCVGPPPESGHTLHASL